MIKESLTTGFLHYAKPIGCGPAAEDHGALGPAALGRENALKLTRS
jgi:hypothetical protein